MSSVSPRGILNLPTTSQKNSPPSAAEREKGAAVKFEARAMTPTEVSSIAPAPRTLKAVQKVSPLGSLLTCAWKLKDPTKRAFMKGPGSPKRRPTTSSTSFNDSTGDRRGRLKSIMKGNFSPAMADSVLTTDEVTLCHRAYNRHGINTTTNCSETIRSALQSLYVSYIPSASELTRYFFPPVMYDPQHGAPMSFAKFLRLMELIKRQFLTTKQMSDDISIAFQHLFKDSDGEGSRALRVNELQEHLTECGVNFDIATFLDGASPNFDGKLNQELFRVLCGPEDPEIVEAFAEMGGGDYLSGNVPTQLLVDRCMKMGFNQEQAEAFGEQIDKDGSGTIDYCEFSAAMNRIKLLKAPLTNDTTSPIEQRKTNNSVTIKESGDVSGRRDRLEGFPLNEDEKTMEAVSPPQGRDSDGRVHAGEFALNGNMLTALSVNGFKDNATPEKNADEAVDHLTTATLKRKLTAIAATHMATHRKALWKKALDEALKSELQMGSEASTPTWHVRPTKAPTTRSAEVCKDSNPENLPIKAAKNPLRQSHCRTQSEKESRTDSQKQRNLQKQTTRTTSRKSEVKTRLAHTPSWLTKQRYLSTGLQGLIPMPPPAREPPEYQTDAEVEGPQIERKGPCASLECSSRPHKARGVKVEDCTTPLPVSVEPPHPPSQRYKPQKQEQARAVWRPQSAGQVPRCGRMEHVPPPSILHSLEPRQLPQPAAEFLSRVTQYPSQPAAAPALPLPPPHDPAEDIDYESPDSELENVPHVCDFPTISTGYTRRNFHWADDE